MSLMDMCIQVFVTSRQLNVTTFKLDCLENPKHDRLLFNNNGGIVIYVEKKRGLFYGTDVKVSYSLFLGYKDAYGEYDFGKTKEVFNKENKSLGRPGDKFLTVEEYAKMKTNSLFNRSGFNKTFAEFEKSFKDFIDLKILPPEGIKIRFRKNP